MIELFVKEIHFLLSGGDTLARQYKIEPNTQIAYLWNNYNAPNTNTLVWNFLLFLFIDDASACEIKQGWVIIKQNSSQKRLLVEKCERFKLAKHATLVLFELLSHF